MQADILQQHFESAFLWADLSLFHSQTRHWELQSHKKISLPGGIYPKQRGTGVVSHPEAERPGNAVFPAHQLNHHTTVHTMVSLVQTSSFILPSLIWKVIDVSCFEFRWLFFEDCYIRLTVCTAATGFMSYPEHLFNDCSRIFSDTCHWED